MPELSQQVFHLFDGQDRDKLFDLCLLFKLVCFYDRFYSAKYVFTNSDSGLAPL